MNNSSSSKSHQVELFIKTKAKTKEEKEREKEDSWEVEWGANEDKKQINKWTRWCSSRLPLHSFLDDILFADQTTPTTVVEF